MAKKPKSLSDYIKKVWGTDGSRTEWFGYYNYDTLNSNQSYILCNRNTVDGVKPKKGLLIELGYYDISKNEWHKIGESDSWNWQQGAMLQWIPGKGNEDKVIFNLSKNGRLASRIYDIHTNENRDIDWPIYGIMPDGKTSITIDLERSYWCRAYHYESVANKELDVAIPLEDGIFEVDLEQNKRKRLISIEDVLKLDADEDFKNLKHWFEHVMISPSGKRFCFLHRFSPVEDALQYQTRLCICNSDGSTLQVVSGWRNYSLSHFGWKDDDSFVIYSVKMPSMQKTLSKSMRQSSGHRFNIYKVKSWCLSCAKYLLPQFVKEIIKGNKANSYHYYELGNDGIFYLKEKWDLPQLRIDGHPSFTEDGRYMITDSYPDKRGYQHLMVYDTKNRKVIELGHFYAFYQGNPASCDLHPKLCRNNNYVAIDTAYNSKHHLELYNIDWKHLKQKFER